MNGNNALLSICCLGYKHSEFLEECINSIWSSDYKNIEIIALDDGSNDGSVEKLKKLQAISPCPFILLEQENSGNIAQNFNKLLAKASGGYVTFMSFDDIFTKNAFAKKMEIVNNDDKIAVVISKKVITRDIYNREKLLVVWEETDNISNDELVEVEYSKGSFAIQGNIFKKEVIDAVCGFDEDLLGDDIVVRTKVLQFMKKNKQWKFATVDNPSFVYRRHLNNISNDGVNILARFLECYERYWPNRPYPEFIVQTINQCCLNADFEKTWYLLIRYPKAMQLILVNKFVGRAIANGISRKHFGKCLFDYLYCVQETQEFKKYIFFNSIKVIKKRSIIK